MIENLFKNLSDLIFPPSCALCGVLFDPPKAIFLFASRHPAICKECELTSKKIFGPVTAIARSTKYVDGMFSCFGYGGAISHGISKLKFFGELNSLNFFSDSIVALFLRYVKFCDVLMPVPMHESALVRRGFSQSALLAMHVGKLVGVRCDLKGLACERKVREQVGLSADERMMNLKDAFAVVRKNTVTGRTIVIIDDVLTTGSTVGECAKVLKKAGARRVVALTLARTS